MQSSLVRFCIVGGISSVCYFLLSYVQISKGVKPGYAGMTSYILTFGATYYAQHNWTFGTAVPFSRSLPRYFLLQLGAATASSFSSQFLAVRFNWGPLVTSVVVTSIAAGASFLVSKFWVFAK